MLKLQLLGHLMWRTSSLEKTLILEKIEGRRRSGQQRVRELDGIINTMEMSLSKLWETVKGREAWPAAVHGVTKSRKWQASELHQLRCLASPHTHFLLCTLGIKPITQGCHENLMTSYSWELNDIIRIAWSRCGFQPLPLPPVSYLTSLLPFLSPFLLSTSISKDVKSWWRGGDHIKR